MLRVGSISGVFSLFGSGSTGFTTYTYRFFINVEKKTIRVSVKGRIRCRGFFFKGRNWIQCLFFWTRGFWIEVFSMFGSGLSRFIDPDHRDKDPKVLAKCSRLFINFGLEKIKKKNFYKGQIWIRDFIPWESGSRCFESGSRCFEYP